MSEFVPEFSPGALGTHSSVSSARDSGSGVGQELGPGLGAFSGTMSTPRVRRRRRVVAMSQRIFFRALCLNAEGLFFSVFSN